MASITLRNLDEQTKERLRVRAARQGRSMEDEARSILRTALAKDTKTVRNLAQAIRKRFEPLGGLELELPVRESMREPPRPSK
jgi:plasmid stability protein